LALHRLRDLVRVGKLFIFLQVSETFQEGSGSAFAFSRGDQFLLLGWVINVSEISSYAALVGFHTFLLDGSPSIGRTYARKGTKEQQVPEPLRVHLNAS